MSEISKKDFVFSDKGERAYEKVKVNHRTFARDAWLRFRKNRSSVAAAIIIALLVLYAILVPIVSPYGTEDKDSVYIGYPPYIEFAAGFGIFDGGTVYESRNEASLGYLNGIKQETGLDPLIKIISENETVTVHRGKEVKTKSYKLRVNKYYETGIVRRIMTKKEYDEIVDFQNETGIRVLYPCVDSSLIGYGVSDANIWYLVSDGKGTPLYDENGGLIPAYLQNKSLEGTPYTGTRISGDNGDYVYSIKRGGALECRVCYYNYYIFKNGTPPMYPLGTNTLGQDLFSAIGYGARFSLVFALIVSAVNLSVGAVYGAVQGYYGGTVDLVLDRIAELISGMPFIVVATLFSLHLSDKVGTAGSFLFAFVLTGWIGMAVLTRKQFYRFRGREFVLAARTLGASDGRLMAKHIFPNSAGTLITGCALMIPGVISSETTFSYLGIIDLSEFSGTSLGTLMSQGQTSMTTAPHAMLFPALYFSLLLISFNLFGNGLRDAFNPLMRGTEA